MTRLNSDQFNHERETLNSRAVSARTKATDFKNRHFNGPREQALAYCLTRAADLAEGCILVADASLPCSLLTLLRSLYECFLRTCWIAISEENAEIFQETGTNQLKRIALDNLQHGYAKIIHKTTGEDATQRFMDDPLMEKIPRLPEWKKMAHDAGLEQVHSMMYGMLSMFAHGSEFGVAESAKPDDQVFISVASANALINCILLVAENWIVRRVQTSTADIFGLLHIPPIKIPPIKTSANQP